MTAVRMAKVPHDVAVASVTDPAAVVLQSLGARALAILISDDRVTALMTRTQLTALATDPAPLAEQAARLPSLVTVESDTDELEPGTLLDLADVLSLLPEVPGALVERGDQPYGVFTRAEVAAALPLEVLAEASSERLGSVPDLPSRRYVCRKCSPPSYRFPRSAGGRPPECRRDWLHGAMELEG